MLADTVELLRDVEASLELRVPPSDAAVAWFREAHPDLPVRRQRGGELGERLAHGFEESFRRGVAAVMAVGADHPTLPPAFVRDGFDALADRDAVVGPSRDGGYYAVAVRREAWPAASALFRDIPWSSPRVTEVTRRVASEAGLDLGELARWYDVDRPEDLEALRRDASPGSRSLRMLERLTDGTPDEAREERGGSRW